MKQVSVLYFALLRDQRGISQEMVSTNAGTAAELYEELKSAFKFSLPANLIKVSINRTFEPLAHKIADGDEVVFIPPVAGG